LELLGLARDIVAFNLPARVGRLFGVSSWRSRPSTTPGFWRASLVDVAIAKEAAALTGARRSGTATRADPFAFAKQEPRQRQPMRNRSTVANLIGAGLLSAAGWAP